MKCSEMNYDYIRKPTSLRAVNIARVELQNVHMFIFLLIP